MSKPRWRVGRTNVVLLDDRAVFQPEHASDAAMVVEQLNQREAMLEALPVKLVNSAQGHLASDCEFCVRMSKALDAYAAAATAKDK